MREAWTTPTNTKYEREKIQVLSLAKQCHAMKPELLTNTTVVDDPIRFVQDKSSSTNSRSIRIMSEPLYQQEGPTNKVF